MESTTSRYLAGLSGNVSGWDWQTAFGQTKNKAVQTNSNDEINADAFVTAYLNGSIDFIYPKDPAGYAAVSYSGLRSSEYTVTFFDAKAAGEIAQLPAGPLALATGFEWRQEELFDTSDALTLANLSLGGGAASARGNRSAYAMFAELNIPVTKQIEAQAAVRFDRYSDFGETVNPKIAVKYQPLNSLAVRASYSESFKAPSLYQLFKNVASPDYQELIDTPRCAVTGAPIDCDPILRPVRADGAAGAGGLQPEKGKAYNVGFVWQPTVNSSISVDTWKIKKTDAIQTQDAQAILNQNLTQYIKRQPNGQIEYVIASYRNIGGLEVAGTDVDATVNFGLGSAGKLVLGATATYLSKYDEIDGGVVTPRLGTMFNGQGFPRLRSQLRANWQFGDFSTTLIQNRRSSFADEEPFNDRIVSAFTTYDLQVGYTGFKDTDVRVGARNITNKMPPISFSSYVPFDQNNDSAKGRFVYLILNHRFK
jgi:iron complex outermembrane receptor protein